MKSLIAPLPPTASRRHTGQKRKGTDSAQRSAFLAILLILISRCLQIEKKMRYRVAVPRTREENSPIPVPLDSKPPAMRALQLRVKKDGTLPTNPTDHFNFVVDTCWRLCAKFSLPPFALVAPARAVPIALNATALEVVASHKIANVL